MGAPFNAW
jgi:hypothetical protein